ncbi:hypothetical protein FJY94_04890 [Candidatus Kaiserbacteria bacterium]|nr:hypothetical protein [Candidatus Kaiserbacteria bacterium]
MGGRRAADDTSSIHRKGKQDMLTKTFKTRHLALETIEWIGIGVVLIIVAVVAYRALGSTIVGWIQQVAGAIGG